MVVDVTIDNDTLVLAAILIVAAGAAIILLAKII